MATETSDEVVCAPDGTEIERVTLDRPTAVFFADGDCEQAEAVHFELVARGDDLETLRLRCRIPARRMGDVPDPGGVGPRLALLNPALPCEIELTMTSASLRRLKPQLRAQRDWQARAALRDGERFPLVDLRCYRLDRFGQLARMP